MEKKKKRIFWLLATVLFSVSCKPAAYDEKQYGYIDNDDEESAISSFFTNNDGDIQVYTFDLDDTISSNGKGYKTPYHLEGAYCSSDMVLIKSGNCEILADAGSQVKLPGNQTVQRLYKNNVKPKLDALINDGVIEYLILSHADFDHISLLAEGSIVRDYLKDKTAIKHIIDFDSMIGRYHSNPNGDSESSSMFYTETYRSYCQNRNAAFEHAKTVFGKKATKNAAADFFVDCFSKNNRGILNVSNGHYVDSTDKALALPDHYIEKEYSKGPLEIQTDSVLNEARNNINSLIEENGAALVNASSDNVPAYYFDIPLEKDGSKEGVHLRILYQWFYDHVRNPGAFNSLDRNNLSVCFEVLNSNFKYLSTGDAVGQASNSLFNYYKNTDVLKNVSLYKLAHHGSTENDANKDDVYGKSILSIAKPQILTVSGVAMRKGNNQILANGSATELKKALFDTINKYCPNSALLVTNTISKKCKVDEEELQSSKCDNRIVHKCPLYGDIKVTSKGNSVTYSYSYIGEVSAFFDKDNENVSLTTKGKGLMDTKWYETFKKLESETEKQR